MACPICLSYVLIGVLLFLFFRGRQIRLVGSPALFCFPSATIGKCRRARLDRKGGRLRKRWKQGYKGYIAISIDVKHVKGNEHVVMGKIVERENSRTGYR